MLYKRDFREEFLRMSGWTVVPVESGLHFDEADATALAAACAARGIKSLTATLIEDVACEKPLLKVEATQSGLMAFSHDAGGFSFALGPEDLSFLVVCTVDDYFLVAGSEAFVVAALGKPLEEARQAFDDYARDAFWSPSERAALERIAQRYRTSPR